MVEPLKKSTLVLLALLMLFHVVVNIWWWQLNTVPLAWDQANHTQIAQQLYYCFKQKPFSSSCWTISNYYPIATHLVAAGLFFVTGPSGQAAQYLGTVFTLAMIGGVFAFFYETTKNQRLALGTVFLVSLTPVIADVGRYLMTDMPLLACTFWSMYFLRKSRGFLNTKMSLAAFALAGLAVFTKWYGAFYLLVPFIWELWAARKVLLKSVRRVQIGKNIVLGSLLAILIAAPWYLVNFSSMLEQTLYYAGADDSQAKNLLSWEALTWYLMLAFKYQLFPFLFGVMLAGLALFTATERKKWWLGYVLFYILAEYAIFTFFGNKAIRYSFHLVVMYCFLIAYLVDWVAERKKWWGVVLGGVILLYWLFFFITLSFDWPVKSYRYVKNIPLLGWTELVNISDDPIRGVDGHDWPVTEISTKLLGVGKQQPGAKILVLVDYPYLNSSNLLVALLEQKAPNELNILLESPESRVAVLQQEGAAAYLAQYDYILVTTNEVGHDWHRGVFERGEIQKYLFSHLDQFSTVQTFTFPLDGLLPSIIEGQNLPGNRLVRQQACKKTRCNQILLLQPKTPSQEPGV